MSVSLNNQYPAAKRPISLITNEDDEAIVFVTLACGQHAFLDADDFHRLMAWGLSPLWFVADNGSGRGYVRVTVPESFGWDGHSAPISRLIMTPHFRGHVVRHCDGNRLNLKRQNLAVSEFRTRAKARERLLLTK